MTIDEVAVTLGGQVIVGGWLSVTVTVKLTELPPVVPQVTVVLPTGKVEPVGGVQVVMAQRPLPAG